MNKLKRNWMTILEGAKDYDVKELNKFVLENIDKVSILKDRTTALLMMYRNKLLAEAEEPEFTGNITKENIQDWFLEPISESQFNYIKKCMVKNNWTIKELWMVCKNEHVSITTIVKCRNERAA